MIASIKRRLAEGEGGFTLIELLVVMIIISILMAVAVPAYLGQKQKAVASTAKTNIKSISDTVESCAASLTDGTYKMGASDCTLPATVTANEPSLSNLTLTATLAPIAGAFGIMPILGGGQVTGYQIQTQVNVSGTPAYFAFTKDATGKVTKSCGSTQAPAGGVATGTNPKVCPTGLW